MSDTIFPLQEWPEGIAQASVPANENALRAEALRRPCLGVSNNVSTPNDGDLYLVGSAPTGSFATFMEDDLAFARVTLTGTTWHHWAPTDGLTLIVSGVRKIYDESSTSWIDDPSVSGGGGGSDMSSVSALSTSGSVAVDCSLGDYFTLALAGNVTGFTFSNLPGSGKGATKMIRITQDSTARTVAWPASFKWAGGVAGVVSTGSGAVDVLAITTFDNGTTWEATLSKAFA